MQKVYPFIILLGVILLFTCSCNRKGMKQPPILNQSVSENSEEASGSTINSTTDNSAVDNITDSSSVDNTTDSSISSDSSNLSQSQTQTEASLNTISEYFEKYWEPLPWGNINDEMKTYEDHMEKNNYKDYNILTWMVLPDSTSVQITLSTEIMGSHFLTSLQEMKPLPPPQELPSDSSFATVLSITDDKITTVYTFFENGDIYTEQNGNKYYLGNSDFEIHYRTMIFLVSAGEMYSSDVVLPDFNISQEHSNTMDNKHEFSFSDYDVYYVPNDYGDLGTPLLIEKSENKEYILNTLSKSWTAVPITQRSGSGLIIRLHNQQETLNFMVYNDYLVNYQYSDNTVAFKLPNDFFRNLQLIAAKEIAYKLKN